MFFRHRLHDESDNVSQRKDLSVSYVVMIDHVFTTCSVEFYHLTVSGGYKARHYVVAVTRDASQ